jgi:DnaJ-class molecular chaperone
MTKCSCDNGKVLVLNGRGDFVECTCHECKGTGYIEEKE